MSFWNFIKLLVEPKLHSKEDGPMEWFDLFEDPVFCPRIQFTT